MDRVALFADQLPTLQVSYRRSSELCQKVGASAAQPLAVDVQPHSLLFLLRREREGAYEPFISYAPEFHAQAESAIQQIVCVSRDAQVAGTYVDPKTRKAVGSAVEHVFTATIITWPDGRLVGRDTFLVPPPSTIEGRTTNAPMGIISQWMPTRIAYWLSGRAQAPVQMWSLDIGREAREIHSVTFSDDGTSLVVVEIGPRNGFQAKWTVKEFNIRDGTLIKQFSAEGYPTDGLTAISPDGALLALTVIVPDTSDPTHGFGEMQLWDIRTGKILSRLKQADSYAFLPVGKALLLSSNVPFSSARHLDLYDLTTLSLSMSFDRSAVRNGREHLPLAVSPNGSMFAIAAAGANFDYFNRFIAFDAASGKRIAEIDLPFAPSSMMFADETRVAFTSGPSLAIINIESRRLTEYVNASHRRVASWSSDLSYLVLEWREYFGDANKDNQPLRSLYDMRAMKVVDILHGDVANWFSADGSLLAGFDSNKILKLYRLPK